MFLCTEQNGLERDPIILFPDITKVEDTVLEYEPQCNKDGDFEPKQCLGDVCVCVLKNGTALPDSTEGGRNLECKESKFVY